MGFLLSLFFPEFVVQVGCGYTIRSSVIFYYKGRKSLGVVKMSNSRYLGVFPSQVGLRKPDVFLQY